MYRLWRDETLYQIWTKSSKPRRSYCYLDIWPNDLECRVTCCARLWDNCHQVWYSTTYPCLNYGVLMLIRYVMLWPWPLIRWPWKFIVHQAWRDVIKVCTTFERNRTIHGWVNVCSSVCLFVRLSVKRVNCDKTEKNLSRLFTPYERSFSLVFWEKKNGW